ncbi:MAG: efflux RND transporter periplasmic adaptor subunit [Pirellulaceae bacterium]|jgi:RND family efflux transporter MFP subunit|nr:efflux RND transporter periplasmic adaptor subunit [Pirellulaceae bacterium]
MFRVEAVPRLQFLLLGVLAIGGCTAAAEMPGPPPPPTVTVAPAIKRQVVDYDEYTGRIQAKETVEVRARVSGYLQEINFRDGDMVAADEVLFKIDPSTYQALYDQSKAQIDLWQAKFDFAEATLARNVKLRDTGAVSKEDYESSLASRNEAAAAMTSARADTEARLIDLQFCEVKSPIAGKIDRTYVTKGNLVQSGPGEPTLLTRIVSVDPMYVYFDIDELALLKYTENRAAEEGGVGRIPLREKRIPVEITLADGSVYPEPGFIDFGSNVVDPGTGTLTARAEVANPAAILTPGLFVRVRVTSAMPYEAVLVAEAAIGTNQNERFVYVVNAEGNAERRKVVLGSKQGNARVIREGVAEGEQVIINGLLIVRPDKPVTAQEGTMPEPPDVDGRLLRPQASPGESAPNDSPAASSHSLPHEVRKPIER